MTTKEEDRKVRRQFFSFRDYRNEKCSTEVGERLPCCTFPSEVGPGFALRNRDQRPCGEWSANRTHCRRSTGPLLLVFSARGSRPETEIKGLAGNGARTAPAAGGRPGRYYRIFRPGVRARKPRSKSLRGMEREPHPLPSVDRAAIIGFFGPVFSPLPPAFFPIKKPACGRQSWLAAGRFESNGKRLPTACRFSLFTFLTAVPWKPPARSR